MLPNKSAGVQVLLERSEAAAQELAAMDAVLAVLLAELEHCAPAAAPPSEAPQATDAQVKPKARRTEAAPSAAVSSKPVAHSTVRSTSKATSPPSPPPLPPPSELQLAAQVCMPEWQAHNLH